MYQGHFEVKRCFSFYSEKKTMKCRHDVAMLLLNREAKITDCHEE